MTTWRSAVPLPMQRPSGAGWLRVAWRGAVLGTVVYGGLLVLRG
ncbi:1-acyl-sn-glycerol-3-phosphate acyltransferase, partial [Candidatus Falkowbacteria bacterium]|nr:1-acyl-sn-glycerol-3-phosphate acyltransferase [Candidatus Falkowbacteria bacterium]